MSLTMRDRIALILDEPHGRLEVVEDDGQWRIQPSAEYADALRLGPSQQIHLNFRDLGDHPQVMMIRNSSSVAGWGTAMVQALERGYPQARSWKLATVSQNGKVFWHKFTQRSGISIGRDLAQAASEIEAEIARIEAAGDYVDAYRTPGQARSLDDLDAEVAARRHERSLPQLRRRWGTLRNRLGH